MYTKQKKKQNLAYQYETYVFETLSMIQPFIQF